MKQNNLNYFKGRKVKSFLFFPFLFLLFIITTKTASAQHYYNLYTDAVSNIVDANFSGGDLTEATGNAFEGTYDIVFDYQIDPNLPISSFQLTFDEFGILTPIDASDYDTLEISFNGAIGGSTIYVSLIDADGNFSTSYGLDPVGEYATVQIPFSMLAPFDFSKLSTIDFSLSGIGGETGEIRVDNIRLHSKSNAPEITVMANSLIMLNTEDTFDFGNVTSGSVGNVNNFSVLNLGNSVLHLTGTPKVAISGTDASMFSVDQTSLIGDIDIAGSSSFTIKFSPTSEGDKSAELTIQSDDPDEGTYTIYLSGTGTAAPTSPEINVKVAGNDVATTGSYDFGTVTEMTTGSNVVFIVENLGTSALSLTGTPKVLISGTDGSMFTIDQSSLSSSIASSSNSTFTIAFAPTSTGAKSATITITNNDSNEGTYTINLTGTGSVVATSPEINVKVAGNDVATAGSYDFGTITEMTTGSNVVFTVENLGTSALSLTGIPKISISGTDASMFTIDQSSLSSSIASSSSSTFTIAFAPASTGAKSATITITNNDSNEGSYTINLTGTGSVATSIINGMDYEKYKVSPNPFYDKVTVTLNEADENVKLKVLNSYGITVWESKGENFSGDGEFLIELGNVPYGIYYVEIISSQGTTTRKVVKQ